MNDQNQESLVDRMRPLQELYNMSQHLMEVELRRESERQSLEQLRQYPMTDSEVFIPQGEGIPSINRVDEPRRFFGHINTDTQEFHNAMRRAAENYIFEPNPYRRGETIKRYVGLSGLKQFFTASLQNDLILGETIYHIDNLHEEPRVSFTDSIGVKHTYIHRIEDMTPEQLVIARNLLRDKAGVLSPSEDVEESPESYIKNIINKHMSTLKTRITISGLLNDLNRGITRLKGDPGYSEQRGSIEEKYSLSKTDVKEIFKHPKLKNLKVRIPEEISYELIDDTQELPKEEKKETAKTYGTPSKAAQKRIEVMPVDSNNTIEKKESQDSSMTLVAEFSQVGNSVEEHNDVPF